MVASSRELEEDIPHMQEGVQVHITCKCSEHAGEHLAGIRGDKRQ